MQFNYRRPYSTINSGLNHLGAITAIPLWRFTSWITRTAVADSSKRYADQFPSIPWWTVSAQFVFSRHFLVKTTFLQIFFYFFITFSSPVACAKNIRIKLNRLSFITRQKLYDETGVRIFANRLDFKNLLLLDIRIIPGWNLFFRESRRHDLCNLAEKTVTSALDSCID